MAKIRRASEGEHDRRMMSAAALALRPSFRNEQLPLEARQVDGVADLPL